MISKKMLLAMNEQIEEEGTTSKVATQMRLVGGSGHGLLMLDRELGVRTFVYPPPALGGE